MDQAQRARGRQELSIFEQVRGVAADLLGVPPERVTAESSPETLERWDSVQHLNLVLALEEKFGLRFNPEEMEQMHNIAGIASLVEDKLKQCT